MKGNLFVPILMQFLLCISACANDHDLPGTKAQPVGAVTAVVIVRYEMTDMTRSKTIRIDQADHFGNATSFEFKLPADTIIIQPGGSDLVTASIGISPQISFLPTAGDTVTIVFRNNAISVRSKTWKYVTADDFAALSDSLFKNTRNKIESIKTLLFDKNIFPGGFYSFSRKKNISPASYSENATLIKNLNFVLATQEQLTLDSLLRTNQINKRFHGWISAIIKINKISIANTLDQQNNVFNFGSNYDRYGFLTDTSIDFSNSQYKGFLTASYISDVILHRRREKNTGGQFFYNYKNAFDSAKFYLSGPKLAYAMFFCLRQIKESYPGSVYQNYKQKFYQQVEDTALINYIKANLDNSLVIAENGFEDIVRDNQGQVHKLKDILNRKQVSYIDFWASWCAPCIEALPEAKKLNAVVNKTKDIGLIYLSIDTDFAKWKNASRQFHLNDASNSFQLLDQNEAAIIKVNQIYSIPRYLVVGKNGKVLVGNAVHPDNKEILKILTELAVPAQR